MEFKVYDYSLTFTEFESVLKNNLSQLKESFLGQILDSKSNGEKLDYSLEEMAAEIKAYEDLLVSVYDYIYRRENENGKQKKK